MSVPVPLDRVRSATEERGQRAYVLTVSDDGRPHAVDALVVWEGNVLVADVGRRSAGNATKRPSVSLLYPVRGAGDHSLIVDGTATIVPGDDGHRLLVTPTWAVLHRSAPAPDPTATGCGSDCVPLVRPCGSSGA